MKVTAAIVASPGGRFEIVEIDLDAPRYDEVLVKILAVGVCHTDVVAQQGGFGFTLPAVLGHEGAGVVEAVGEGVQAFSPGDRVIISFRSCGSCPKCVSHHPAYCHRFPELNFTGMRLDGSRALYREGSPLISNFFGQSTFASHALTYERNLVRLDDDIPFEFAAPLGCGIQTGAGSVLNVFQPERGSTLLVTGGGAVGLSAVMAARISNCATIVVAEPHVSRRRVALELGATHVIDPLTTPDLASALRAIVPVGVDFALDTTGREDVLTAIMAALAPQGMLGLVGISAPTSRIPGNLNQVITLGHCVRGIIEGDANPERFLPRLLDYYRGGQLPLNKLIHTYPFERINEAVADQHVGRCIKVVLTLS